MSTKLLSVTLLAAFSVGGLAGCSSTHTQSPDVTDNLRRSLDQAGLKDVTVSQDRDKGVVTLGGKAMSDADKTQAESIAKAIAGPQVVADLIIVLPPRNESNAKEVNSDLDKGIKDNFDAALVGQKHYSDVKYEVKNGVITLTGTVDSLTVRAQVETLAAGVPNVKQVVNELEMKNVKATATQG
jgi:osmotically-inducible protein OsmY